MEKKTIGKFISALRKANGMTQKELGEKLFVSDKTISRWERDECTPELSLIPSIAELFDVTTDELLRGERNNPDREPLNSDEIAGKQKARSDKQFRLMLHSRKKKYLNLSFISIGLTLVGFIVAMICNLGFSRGLLGFGLASIFFVAAVICQICFTVSFRLLADEDDPSRAEQIKNANTAMVLASVKIFFGIIIVWAFCLPIAVITLSYFDSYYGLMIDSWLMFGALFAAVAFAVAYCIYKLWIVRLLADKELVCLTDTERKVLTAGNKLLKRVITVFVIAFAVIMIATYIVTDVIGEHEFIGRERFDTPDEFIEYVQTQYDEWHENGCKMLYYDDGASVITRPITPEDGEYPNRKWAEIDGKEYYYNPDFYYDVFYDELTNGEWNIVVTTKEAYYRGKNTYDIINNVLISLHGVNLIACIGWYCIGVIKKKK